MSHRVNLPLIMSVLTAGFSPPSAPGVEQEAPQAQNSSPDELLRSKGLIRSASGPFYILEAEGSIPAQYEALNQTYANWQQVGTLMNQLQSRGAEQQKNWEFIQQKINALQFALADLDQQVAKRLDNERNTPKGGGADPNQPRGDPFDPNRRQAETQGEAARRLQLINEMNNYIHNKSNIEYQNSRDRMEYDRLTFQAFKLEGRFQEQRDALNVTVEKLGARYAELNNDPYVRAALVEVNRNASPRYVLGPAGDYRAKVNQMLQDVLTTKGLRRTRDKKGFESGTDQDARALVQLVRSYEAELWKSLDKRKALLNEADSRERQIAELPRKEIELNNKIARAATASQKAQFTTQLRIERDRIAKYRQEEIQAGKQRQEQAKEILTQREAYLGSVAALRKAVDASQQRHGELAKDIDVELARGELKTKIAPIPKETRAFLEAAEKKIQSEEIAMEPDRAIFWVEATLNGQPKPTRMVIDPGVEFVRISEKLATGLGIRPTEAEPLVELAAGGGQPSSARRIKLKSVRLGTFTVNDVDCLVILKGTEAAPILGASFLDHFTYTLDPDSAKLTLKKVDEKQLIGPTGPRARARK